jgi:endo-1,4-beta-mannosidase
MLIAVYVWGGIINYISVGEDLEVLKRDMAETAKSQGFDPQGDDFRIFNQDGTEVYSYESETEE